MKMLSFFRRPTGPVASAEEIAAAIAIAAESEARRALLDKAYEDAFQAVDWMTHRSTDYRGIFFKLNQEQLRAISDGIVDGWMVSDAYDPAADIKQMVVRTCKTERKANQRWVDVWDAAAAELDGRLQHQTAYKAAVGCGKDEAGHGVGCTIAKENAELYGRGIGLGIAYGWPIRSVPREVRQAAPMVRPVVKKAIANGRYARDA